METDKNILKEKLYLKIKEIRYFLVHLFYANTRFSPYIRSAIKKLLKEYDENFFVLNVGSGNKRLAPHVKNLDIFNGENIDYVCDAANIPIESNTVDLIITQEAFEHIPKPNQAIKECYRILKNGGKIYFQVPFIVGYHPGPTDFYRFTREGIENFLIEAGFKVEKVEITIAGAWGFYVVAVEFFSILFSGPISVLYIPMKGFFAILLTPIKLIDFWFRLSKQKDRIPAGYYAIGSKIL